MANKYSSNGAEQVQNQNDKLAQYLLNFGEGISRQKQEAQDLAVKGQQKIGQIGAEGAQHRQSAEAQNALDLAKEAEISKRSKQTEAELRHQYPDAAISTGANGQLSVNPETAAILKSQLNQQNKVTSQTQKFGQAYDKQMDPYNKGFSAVQNIHSGLDQNSAQGDKIAAVNAARIAEGQGQRLFQGLVQQMGLNPSLYKTAADVENYISSNPKSVISPQARDSMRQVAISHYNTIMPEYQAKRSELMSRAQYEAPEASKNGYLNNLGTGIEQTAQSLGQKNAAYTADMAKRQAVAQPPNQQQGIVGRARQTLADFLKPQSSQPASANTAQPETLEQMTARRKAAMGQ